MEEFGRKIRDLRLKNDLSLRDLSERSGVSYSFINSIEKNRYKPSRETVIALANALNGADKDELLLLAGFSPENNDYKSPSEGDIYAGIIREIEERYNVDLADPEIKRKVMRAIDLVLDDYKKKQ